MKAIIRGITLLPFLSQLPSHASPALRPANRKKGAVQRFVHCLNSHALKEKCGIDLSWDRRLGRASAILPLSQLGTLSGSCQLNPFKQAEGYVDLSLVSPKALLGQAQLFGRYYTPSSKGRLGPSTWMAGLTQGRWKLGAYISTSRLEAATNPTRHLGVFVGFQLHQKKHRADLGKLLNYQTYRAGAPQKKPGPNPKDQGGERPTNSGEERGMENVPPEEGSSSSGEATETCYIMSIYREALPSEDWSNASLNVRNHQFQGSNQEQPGFDAGQQACLELFKKTVSKCTLERLPENILKLELFPTKEGSLEITPSMACEASTQWLKVYWEAAADRYLKRCGSNIGSIKKVADSLDVGTALETLAALTEGEKDSPPEKKELEGYLEYIYKKDQELTRGFPALNDESKDGKAMLSESIDTVQEVIENIIRSVVGPTNAKTPSGFSKLCKEFLTNRDNPDVFTRNKVRAYVPSTSATVKTLKQWSESIGAYKDLLSEEYVKLCRHYHKNLAKLDHNEKLIGGINNSLNSYLDISKLELQSEKDPSDDEASVSLGAAIDEASGSLQAAIDEASGSLQAAIEGQVKATESLKSLIENSKKLIINEIIKDGTKADETKAGGSTQLVELLSSRLTLLGNMATKQKAYYTALQEALLEKNEAAKFNSVPTQELKEHYKELFTQLQQSTQKISEILLKTDMPIKIDLVAKLAAKELTEVGKSLGLFVKTLKAKLEKLNLNNSELKPCLDKLTRLSVDKAMTLKKHNEKLSKLFVKNSITSQQLVTANKAVHFVKKVELLLQALKALQDGLLAAISHEELDELCNSLINEEF